MYANHITTLKHIIHNLTKIYAQRLITLRKWSIFHSCIFCKCIQFQEGTSKVNFIYRIFSEVKIVVHFVSNCLLKGKVEGMRQRGKPRPNWEEMIKTWNGMMTLQKCTRMVDDRDVSEKCYNLTSELGEDARIDKQIVLKSFHSQMDSEGCDRTIFGV